MAAQEIKLVVFPDGDGNLMSRFAIWLYGAGGEATGRLVQRVSLTFDAAAAYPTGEMVSLVHPLEIPRSKPGDPFPVNQYPELLKINQYEEDGLRWQRDAVVVTDILAMTREEFYAARLAYNNARKEDDARGRSV